MSISREVLAKYIKPGCMFLETGSRWGTTLIRAAELGARSVQGCEVDGLYQAISERMLCEVLPEFWVKGYAQNYLLSSCDFLKRFPACDGDVIVFLDAHSDTASPVIAELDVISSWRNKPKVILVDDLRCMKGWGVSCDAIMEKLVSIGYKVKFEHGVEPLDIMVGTRG